MIPNIPVAPGPPRYPTGPYATTSYDKQGGMDESLTALPQLNVNDQLSAFLNWYKRQGIGNTPQRPLGNTPASAPRPVQQERTVEDNTTRQLQQLQLRKMQGEVQDAESIRNLRKTPIDMGPNMGLAYDWDTRKMNPIQQKAVSPENSVVANGGVASSGSAGAPIAEDLAKFAGGGGQAEGQKGQAPNSPGGGAFDIRKLLEALLDSNNAYGQRQDQNGPTNPYSTPSFGDVQSGRSSTARY